MQQPERVGTVHAAGPLSSLILTQKAANTEGAAEHSRGAFFDKGLPSAGRRLFPAKRADALMEISDGPLRSPPRSSHSRFCAGGLAKSKAAKNTIGPEKSRSKRQIACSGLAEKAGFEPARRFPDLHP